MTDFIFNFVEEMWFKDYREITIWLEENGISYELIHGYQPDNYMKIKAIIGVSITGDNEVLHFKMRWQDMLYTHYENEENE